VVLALALTALVVAGVSNGLLLTGRALATMADSTTARTMVDECLAVTRWLRDDGALASVSDGVYGFDRTGDGWELAVSPDVTGEYTRSLTVSGVDDYLSDILCSVAFDDNGTPASTSAFSRISR
jgi:hypothetical protein